MATTTIEGITYNIPEVGARNWGENVTNLLKVLGDNSLRIKGSSSGNLALTSDADFGVAFGILAKYITSKTANPAAAGFVRLAYTDVISWRDSGNTADLSLALISEWINYNSEELVGVNRTQTLIQKTLTSPVLNTQVTGDALETDLAASALSTKLATAAAIKTYVDNVAAAQNDASEITYTPAEVNDWTGSVDPGNTNGALDQLAQRVTDDEAALGSHTGDATIHFTEASIDHTAITNIGTNTHAQIDTHISNTAAHGVAEVMGTSGSTLQTVIYDSYNDSSTGGVLTLTPTKVVARLTSVIASDSIAGIDPTNTKVLVLTNTTANELPVANESASATAANRIITGTGDAITLAAGASITLVYDASSSRWRVVGGSGGGAGGLALASVDNTDSPVSAAISTHYLVDTTTAAVTITLPDSSSISALDLDNAVIRITDAGENASTNNITIARSGSDTIDGLAEDLIFDVDGVWVQLMWDAGLGTWVTDDPFTNGLAPTTDVEAGVNYISNGSFNTDISGWTASAGTLSQDTVTNIEGAGSLLFTSSAAISTIDGNIEPIPSIDQGILLGVEAVIDVDVAAAIGDFTVEVYDSTNMAIKAGPVDLKPGRNRITTNELWFVAEASTVYKFRIKFTDTTASRTAKVDRVKVTSDRSPAGAVVTTTTTTTVPWTSGSAGTVTQNKFVWRRSGEYMEIDLHYQQTAAGSAGTGVLRFTLPNGLTIDGNKWPIKDSSPSAEQDEMIAKPFGTYIANTTGTAATVLVFAFAQAATEIGLCSYTGSSADYADLNANILGNATPSFNGTLRVPIAEWAGAGTVNLMDRGITTSTNKFKTTSVNETVASGGTILFATGVHSVGDISFASGIATVNTAGYYRVSATIRVTVAGVTILNLEQSGTRIAESGDSTSGVYASLYSEDWYDAGDTIEITNASGRSITTANIASINQLSISRISDQSAIAPVGFGTSDEADTSAKYLLPLIQTGTFNLLHDSDTINVTGYSAGNTVSSAAHYTRMGNRVFVSIQDADITGYSHAPTSGSAQSITFRTTGLPAIDNATRFHGTATIYGNTSTEYSLGHIILSSTSNTHVTLVFPALTGASQTITIYGFNFSYIAS